MRTLILPFLVSLLVLFTFNSCENGSSESPDNPPNLRTLSNAEMRVASGGNDFAFNLFRKTSTPGENGFISPLSVSMALGMVMNGASESTRQSILNTIDYGDLSAEEVNQGYKDLTALLLSMDKKVNLGIANSVWYNEKYAVANPFKSTIETCYDGRVTGLNFNDPHAKDIINGWVEDKTNDRIKNLINDITPTEVMFLVNAIYFKGDWTYSFSKTYDAPFFPAEGGSVSTKTMFRPNGTLSYFRNMEVELIDLPYGNEQFRFTVLLPSENHSLEELSASLDAATLMEWLGKAHERNSELELPKFKMEWKQDLLGILEDLGMSTSGFPHLLQTPDELAISRVIHQTFVDVNEKGTEAAAATAVGIELTNSAPGKIQINKPFIFMIREKHSNTILFMGSLQHPG